MLLSASGSGVARRHGRRVLKIAAVTGIGRIELHEQIERRRSCRARARRAGRSPSGPRPCIAEADETNVSGAGSVSVIGSRRAPSTARRCDTVMRYVKFRPGETDAAQHRPSSPTVPRSPPPTTGVTGGLVLLPGVGSGVGDWHRRAVVEMSLPSPVYAGSSRTTIVNVSDAPGASVGMVGQVTIWPAAVQPSAEETKVTPAGNGSVDDDVGGRDGPWFETSSVYVNVSPGVDRRGAHRLHHA